MNKKSYLILGGIGLLLVLLFVFQKNSTEVSINENTPLNEPSFLTYNKGDAGISFKYPNTYNLIEEDANSAQGKNTRLTLIDKEFTPPIGGEGPTTLNVDIFQNNIDKQTPENWIKNNSNSNYKLGDGVIKQTTVGSKPALEYSWSGLYNGVTVVFAHNENIVAISGTYLEVGDPIVKDYRNLLASIKLTPTTVTPKFPQTSVENYLKNNLARLSPEKEVLGGKFFITKLELTSNKNGVVEYEDGHNAFIADFNYLIEGSGEVKISSFVVRK
ncbi:MAG: hypothetical protein M3Q24_01880 [bacterium]|nr:hypothetical protein [bacterium]